MRSLLVVWGVVLAAVFHVEYVDDSADGSALADSTSPVTLPLGFSSLIKTWELDAWRIACG
jgi:hypothetical protein